MQKIKKLFLKLIGKISKLLFLMFLAIVNAFLLFKIIDNFFVAESSLEEIELFSGIFRFTNTYINWLRSILYLAIIIGSIAFVDRFTIVHLYTKKFLKGFLVYVAIVLFINFMSIQYLYTFMNPEDVKMLKNNGFYVYNQGVIVTWLPNSCKRENDLGSRHIYCYFKKDDSHIAIDLRALVIGNRNYPGMMIYEDYLKDEDYTYLKYGKNEILRMDDFNYNLIKYGDFGRYPIYWTGSMQILQN